MAALRRNNMDAYFADTAEQARELALSLIPEGAVCACGGSVTLAETGLFDALKAGNYRFIDRGAAGLSAEEREAAMSSGDDGGLLSCECERGDRGQERSTMWTATPTAFRRCFTDRGA